MNNPDDKMSTGKKRYSVTLKPLVAEQDADAASVPRYTGELAPYIAKYCRHSLDIVFGLDSRYPS
jgi:hypothetical protein